MSEYQQILSTLSAMHFDQKICLKMDNGLAHIRTSAMGYEVVYLAYAVTSTCFTCAEIQGVCRLLVALDRL